MARPYADKQLRESERKKGKTQYLSNVLCLRKHEPKLRYTSTGNCVICARENSRKNFVKTEKPVKVKASRANPVVLFDLEQQRKEKTYDEMSVRERMRNLKF